VTLSVTAPLAERIAAYATEVVRPLAPAMARGGEPRARELIAEAGRRGLAGLLTPAALGGQEAGHVAFAGAVEAVARECASSAVIYDVHVSVASEPFALLGDEDQKRRYLPRLAAGEWLGAFALSEPGSGSDAASLTTRAVRDGDDYVLDGTKMWITNGGEADLYLVMARTGGPGARGISAFLVEAAWPGVRASRPLRKLGLRGSSTAELVLESQESLPLGDGFIANVGHWKQSFTTPGGTRQSVEVRTSEVLQKTDGKWLYLVDHASVGAPPPRAPARRGGRRAPKH